MLLTAKGDFAPGRTSRSKEYKPPAWEIPLFEQLQNNPPDRAGGANNRNRIKHV
jgi:hypothetical protein